MPENSWPELPLAAWKDTYATLHMWTQIVGKVRLALAPHINHWWQVPLYVNACGLTSSAIPYADRTFEVQFDFAEHQLTITVSDGQIMSMPLRPQTWRHFMRSSWLHCALSEFQSGSGRCPWKSRTRFASIATNNTLRTIESMWNVSGKFSCWWMESSRNSVPALSASIVRSISSGEASTWRRRDSRGVALPSVQGADPVTREAYSHEVISAGFWPGGGEVKDAAFYAYAAPEPNGFKSCISAACESVLFASWANFF